MGGQMTIEDIKKEYEEKFDKFPFFVEKHDYMHPWYGEIKHSALGEIWNFFKPYLTSKTQKSSTMSDKENTRSDNEETEQVNNELSTSEDLTCDRHGESDYPMNNGLYFLTDEDKANIERNALIEFSNWCFANDYKSALNKITNYLQEKGIK